MTIRTAKTYICDACMAEKTYNGLDSVPPRWASPRIKQVDSEGEDTLHVCPECTREALDEWLPNNTWWGSTKNWR